jgi:hypothetical protein
MELKLDRRKFLKTSIVAIFAIAGGFAVNFISRIRRCVSADFSSKYLGKIKGNDDFSKEGHWAG